MKLRKYQLKAINDIRNAYQCGCKSPTLVAVCGYGKSFCAAEIAKMSTFKNKRVLVLAHRIELLDQLTDTFKMWGVKMDLCDIESVQSAVHHLKHYDFIITDEAHHGIAKTYRKIYDFNPDAKRLNLTATPLRLGGTGLKDISDILIESVSVKWLIANNYLAPFEYYAPKCVIDTNSLKITNGDYDPIETMNKIDKPAIYGDVFKEWKKYAFNKQTIAFCASIEHSLKVCEMFNSHGIKAVHIDGKTDSKIRKQYMQDFRDGKIMIICNYEIISEGLSVDGCECCLLLRPTQSLTLFLQSSQRCMRYKKGKTAIILDFVKNYERHGLPDTKHEWMLDYGKKRKKINTESDIKARTCPYCYRTYIGINRECPYCHQLALKSEREILIEKEAELTRIKKIEKQELKIANNSLESLKAYGRKKGYKPYWAIMRWKIIQGYKYGKK